MRPAARGGLRSCIGICTGDEASAEDVLARWRAGEGSAARTIDVYLDLVASPLALVINTTGASVIPVGGGLSNVPELITAIDRTVRQRILIAPDEPMVIPAQNRIEPGIVGAAVLGHRRYP